MGGRAAHRRHRNKGVVRIALVRCLTRVPGRCRRRCLIDPVQALVERSSDDLT
jgi:hypothetical protein